MSTLLPDAPVGSKNVEAQREKGQEITVISHSTLFYWWPVWVAGFLMALLTFLGNHRMAVVPTGTLAVTQAQVEGMNQPRDILVAPEGKRLPGEKQTGAPLQPHHLMSTNKNLGGFFVLVLLLVVTVTNVPLRGLWSVIAILTVVSLSILFAYLNWWKDILRFFGLIHIHINAAGYVVIAVCLFVGWAITTFLFDRQLYATFSPGQFRIHLEIGEGETVFDTSGIVVHKRRNDFFRHWILGLGSGDLVVTTGGAHPKTFELPNVLFIGRKIELIEQMIQEREVVQGQMNSRKAPLD